MTHLKQTFNVLPLVLLICSSSIVTSLQVANEQDDVSMIDLAKANLQAAYKKVLEAEHWGANVTDLVLDLRSAGENLTSAYLQLKQLNYTESANQAEDCVARAEYVSSEALLRRDSAIQEAFWAFWLLILGWIISLVTICLATILGWRTFKKRLYRKTMSLKTLEI